MEARCAPGGNSPSSHNTTVHTTICYVSIQLVVYMTSLGNYALVLGVISHQPVINQYHC